MAPKSIPYGSGISSTRRAKEHPTGNRIALQMVKDMLDEASYAASPGHVLPDGGPTGTGSRLVGKLRDRADGDQGD